MEIQLLLAAFSVSFGIICAQPNSLMDSTKALTSEVNHENKLQKNLRNLFDSITKNDMRKTDTYRGILEQEAVREQQVFDTMKEELWFARQRSGYKQNDSFKNGDIGERTAAFKRETNSDDDDDDGPTDLFGHKYYQISDSTEESDEPRRRTTTETTIGPLRKPFYRDCADLKSAMRNYDMKSFVKVIDRVYHRLSDNPTSNPEAVLVLKHIMESCETKVKKKELVERLSEATKQRLNDRRFSSGILDLRTVDQKEGNLVIKLKVNRDACAALSKVLEYIDLEDFKKLYPKERVTVLSLSLNRDNDGSVVEDWIAIFVQDGELVGKGHQEGAACLKRSRYKDLMYKGTPMAEYIEKMMDLFNAAEDNDLEKVKLLVDKVTNVSINANNGRGDTLGHIAAKKNNVNLLRFVLDKYGDQADELYLHIIFQLAVQMHSVDVVKYFVEERKTNIGKGSSAELRTTVMHTAIQYGHLDLLKYFIEERHADINAVDWCDVPLVFYSVEYGHKDIMKYLIEEKGADLKKVDHYEDTILYGPVKRGDIAMLKYLLDERKAGIDINTRNRNGETLVNKAVFWNQFEMLKYLVDVKRADVNLPDKWLTMTPLHFTVSLNRFEMFKYLIEHGADTQVQDEKWRTAIELTTDERFLTYLNDAKKKSRPRRNAPRRC